MPSEEAMEEWSLPQVCLNKELGLGLWKAIEVKCLPSISPGQSPPTLPSPHTPLLS